MKTVFEHIEHIKGKPHHIRKRVAFGAAALGSGVVALAWFAISLATNAFAIQGSTFAMSVGQENVVATTSASRPQVAGAAAAFEDAKPAHIEIVDTTVAEPAKKQSEQTTIPF